jgi:hypothetical protein
MCNHINLEGKWESTWKRKWASNVDLIDVKKKKSKNVLYEKVKKFVL